MPTHSWTIHQIKSNRFDSTVPDSKLSSISSLPISSIFQASKCLFAVLARDSCNQMMNNYFKPLIVVMIVVLFVIIIAAIDFKYNNRESLDFYFSFNCLRVCPNSRGVRTVARIASGCSYDMATRCCHCIAIFLYVSTLSLLRGMREPPTRALLANLVVIAYIAWHSAFLLKLLL